MSLGYKTTFKTHPTIKFQELPTSFTHNYIDKNQSLLIFHCNSRFSAEFETQRMLKIDQEKETREK